MIANFVRRAASDTSGNVAILFGLTLLGMIGIVGIGIDTSRALATKSTLDASADAAALAAVTRAEVSLQSQAYSNDVATAIAAGQSAGAKVFAADAAHVGQTIGGTPTPTVAVAESQVNGRNVLTATVTYTATSPNVFGPIFGSQSVALNGVAKSSLTLPAYMNISVAIDISQSMGLAATSASQTQLAGITGGCAFGCHAYQNGQTGTASYEVQAHNAGIQLRIDVIKSATQNMISTASSLNSGTPLINFALYTFGTGLNTIAASSSNYTSLSNSAAAIDLDSGTDTNGYGDTGATMGNNAMSTLTSAVPTPGNGSSANNALQYVFLMTDGVNDVYNTSSSSCFAGGGQAWQWNHCTAPFDPKQCAALKAKGVIVGVIYTTYLQMPSRAEWTNLVQPFTGSIASSLRSCATGGWYYEATEASDIQAALNALFAQATGHGILTQ